jgi:E3 ubiquitin-protein ligase UBR1
MAFFTNQIQDKHIVYPPTPPGVIDADSQPFKSKRFMPVFSDLRYLVVTEPVQDLIAHNLEYINSFAVICQLFMCIHPNKRAVTTHVEYEGDLWISVFNVTLSLSRVVKVYGEAFAQSTVAQLLAAILIVMHQISAVCNFEEERLDKSKFGPILYHDVIFGDASYRIVDFNVLEGWVSFHHSLHWLLAELFKHVDLLDEEAITLAGLGTLRDVIHRQKPETDILGIIDFPLRGMYGAWVFGVVPC